MKYPRLLIDESKLKHNIDTVAKWCRQWNVSCFAVTKVVCAHPKVVELIEESEIDGFADSRIENLMKIRTAKPKMLLRIASPHEAEAVVEHSDISLQSELSVIAALNSAAQRLNRRHKIVLMIDLGDLREGIYYTERDKILKNAEQISKASHLELYGIGTNLTCYGAILPDERNLAELVAIANRLRVELKSPIPLVSGGNSSSVSLMLKGRMPAGINHLRIGEAIMLGQDTADCVTFPGLHDDAFLLEAELVELMRKPSKPFGRANRNAFGEPVHYEDRGIQLRGILAVGRQDVPADGLIPVESGIEILGASSDHLLVNIESGDYAVGDTLRFKLNYGALLAACTSAYVAK
ncbi:MAG: alanine/ornithine racemase family PLP-dependent enzyme [Clostridia bacterium]|nr:alanine/ornithine racemase family PLP-dependent enzyme [Clostridia bacterium]